MYLLGSGEATLRAFAYRSRRDDANGACVAGICSCWHLVKRSSAVPRKGNSLQGKSIYERDIATAAHGIGITVHFTFWFKVCYFANTAPQRVYSNIP
jgi:hypothetical protein